MPDNETPIRPELNNIPTYWDVVVIGAGPAGALSALELAKDDLNVLLVDKSRYPKEKVCGCCLNQDAIASLKHAGLLRMPALKNAPVLKRLNLYTKFGRASIPLPGGLAVSRQALDSGIAQAAVEHGCVFLPETTAQVGKAIQGYRTLTLRNAAEETSIRASYVIVGDGISGTALKNDMIFAPQVAPSSRIGIGALVPNYFNSLKPGEINMYCGNAGYLGMIIVENGMIDMAAAVDKQSISGANSASSVVSKIMLGCGANPPSNLVQAQWRGTSALTQRRHVLADNHVFLVGDSAGYTEPFSGQGIAWALRCALLIAPLLKRAFRNELSNPEKAWAILYNQEIRSQQKASSLLARLLRHERIFSLIVTALSPLPGLLSPLLAYLNRAPINYQDF